MHAPTHAPPLSAIVRTLVAVLALCAPALATAGAGLGEPRPLDRWYTLEMQGAPAGHMHAERTIAGDRVTSRSTMEMRVRRGTLELSFGLSTEFIETTDGEPIEMSATTALGGAPSTQRYLWTAGGIEHTVTGAGPARTTTLPAPEGKWLPPAAAAAFLSARLRAGADEVIVRTIDPLSGLRIATTKRSGIERTELSIGGRELDVFEMTATADVQPGVRSTEHIDEHGDAVRLETALGGFDVVIALSDEATATGVPAGAPPELMASLFITPSRPIERAHSTRTARYVVRASEGALQDLPTTGYQRVERIDDGSVRITVDMTRPAEDGDDDLENPAFLASTTYLDATDAAVRGLAERAMREATDLKPMAIAERLRAFVHGHIRSKDLSVGFATASEVARSGEGDCTEHAVLLAALLRTQGIPSRVIGGLVYADRFAGGRDIFGYHAWTQALVPDARGAWRWVDLDATLPGRRGYSAAHIALSVSALEDAGPVGGLADLAPLLGRLEIDVEMTR